MASSYARACSDEILGKLSSLKRLSGIETSSLGKWCNHHHWECSKDVLMWHLGTRLSSEHSRAGLTAGLNLRGKAFFNLNNSMFL